MEASSVIEFITWSQENTAAQMYRGQGNEVWPLLPSISRYYEMQNCIGGGPLIVEEALIEKFEFYAHPIKDLRNCSYLEKIVHAQHYGLPTRLLDWTTNPLKALYFAVSDGSCSDKDGIVYCFSPTTWWETTSNDHLVNSISGDDLVTFHPELLNERIAAQEGCFTAFPLSEKYISIPELNEENYSEDVELLNYISIPAKNKIDIEQELKELGINHMTIFPGLEGIAKHVKSMYAGRII